MGLHKAEDVEMFVGMARGWAGASMPELLDAYHARTGKAITAVTAEEYLSRAGLAAPPPTRASRPLSAIAGAPPLTATQEAGLALADLTGRERDAVLAIKRSLAGMSHRSARRAVSAAIASMRLDCRDLPAPDAVSVRVESGVSL